MVARRSDIQPAPVDSAHSWRDTLRGLVDVRGVDGAAAELGIPGEVVVEILAQGRGDAYPDSLRGRVAKMYVQEGPGATAKRTGLSDGTVSRIAADTPADNLSVSPIGQPAIDADGDTALESDPHGPRPIIHTDPRLSALMRRRDAILAQTSNENLAWAHRSLLAKRVRMRDEMADAIRACVARVLDAAEPVAAEKILEALADLPPQASAYVAGMRSSSSAKDWSAAGMNLLDRLVRELGEATERTETTSQSHTVIERIDALTARYADEIIDAAEVPDGADDGSGAGEAAPPPPASD